MTALPHKRYGALLSAPSRIGGVGSPQTRGHLFRCAALLAATVLQVTAAIQTAVGETHAARDATHEIGNREVGSHENDCVHRPSATAAAAAAAHACDGAML